MRGGPFVVRGLPFENCGKRLLISCCLTPLALSVGIGMQCICRLLLIAMSTIVRLINYRQPSIMILRQAAQALSRRLPATARRTSPSLLLSSSSVGIDNFVLTPSVNLQAKRDIWVWGSPPSSSGNRRGFADAVVDNEHPHESHWAQFPMAPPDPIIGLTEVRDYVLDIKVSTSNILLYLLTIRCLSLS